MKVTQLFTTALLQGVCVHDGPDVGSVDEVWAVVACLQTINGFVILVTRAR